MLTRLLSLRASAADWSFSHAGHDASPGPGTAAGPSDTRRGGSNAGPVEATLRRSESTQED